MFGKSRWVYCVGTPTIDVDVDVDVERKVVDECDDVMVVG